jgi:hypothetical protein
MIEENQKPPEHGAESTLGLNPNIVVPGYHQLENIQCRK